MPMKPVSADLSKLLGYRLIAVEAEQNGLDVSSATMLGQKAGGKAGEKVGDKPVAFLSAKIGLKDGEKTGPLYMAKIGDKVSAKLPA